MKVLYVVMLSAMTENIKIKVSEVRVEKVTYKTVITDTRRYSIKNSLDTLIDDTIYGMFLFRTLDKNKVEHYKKKLIDTYRSRLESHIELLNKRKLSLDLLSK